MLGLLLMSIVFDCLADDLVGCICYVELSLELYVLISPFSENSGGPTFWWYSAYFWPNSPCGVARLFDFEVEFLVISYILPNPAYHIIGDVHGILHQ